MNRFTKKGFTLIELLVVIAIISVLSSIVLAQLNEARAKARDATRISNLKNLQIALELYRSDNGGHPVPSVNDWDNDVNFIWGMGFGDPGLSHSSFAKLWASPAGAFPNTGPSPQFVDYIVMPVDVKMNSGGTQVGWPSTSPILLGNYGYAYAWTTDGSEYALFVRLETDHQNTCLYKQNTVNIPRPAGSQTNWDNWVAQGTTFGNTWCPGGDHRDELFILSSS
jgi:prepilin-type N-terminal cleavage/methylation domain-containing protein